MVSQHSPPSVLRFGMSTTSITQHIVSNVIYSTLTNFLYFGHVFTERFYIIQHFVISPDAQRRIQGDCSRSELSSEIYQLVKK